MKRSGWLVGCIVGMLMLVGWASMAQVEFPVIVQNGDRIAEVALESLDETVSGTVAYQGPVFDASDPNWKDPHTYTGVSVRTILDAVGGMRPGDTVSVIAVDGFYKTLPYEAVYGETPGGTVILALSSEDPEWDGAPMLAFLPGDERFSNEDMVATVGEEYAHYYGGDKLSTTGLMVKGVGYVVVGYDGVLPEAPAAAVAEETSTASEADPDPSFSVVHGDQVRVLLRSDLPGMELLTLPGTFTNSASVDYTATYTGVPMATLIGNVPADSTIRVTASDGYSMNYEAVLFLDRSEGTWILAYEENGEVMPLDPGYFRIVQVGETNPHFTSSLSARMVEKIEVLGTYEEYSLSAIGEVTRVFSREELEAGIGCPCHTAEVSATSKGETSVYSGLPLWRLVAYVDDSIFPAVEDGIHYNDEDFNDALAATDYTIVLVAEDGYTQTVASSLIAHDDRFIVAFKQDGLFLDSSSSGFMKFVYDDSVEFPDGTKLKSVKYLVEIRIEF